MNRSDWPDCSACQATFGSHIDPDCYICEGTGKMCPVCKGMAYVRDDQDKLVPCRCGLAARRASKSLAEVSTLQGQLLECSFRNFDLQKATGATEAYRAAAAWAKNPEGWLVIWSRIKGNGKSHLGAAAANHLNANGHLAVMITAPDFLDYLKEAFQPNAPDSAPSRLRRVRESEILILDDLGVEYNKSNGGGTTWAQEQFYKLLDYRYRMRLPTLITTNVPLDRQESRLASRLQDRQLSKVVHNPAPDFRRRKQA